MDTKKGVNIVKSHPEWIEENKNNSDVQVTPEVNQTVLSVNEGINVLSENADLNVTGEVSEKSKSKSENSKTIGGTQSSAATNSSVVELPSVDVMIKETVLAIENELRVKEQNIKAMSKKKSTKPIDFNNAVIEIRFLNGLLSQLKSAAKQAGDFVVNLWKQYVKKSVS